ncbi:MAG: aldehyde oxidase, partial [Devosia sp.]|nr:aldehyde oxidase [Devosia sp.]
MNKIDIAARNALHVSTPHDSAIKQVMGRADYIDDLAEPEGLLHAYLGLSTKAAGTITGFDVEAVRGAPGVIGVLTASDVPAENDISSVHRHDEPVFATTEVKYHGQPLFAVVAETRDAARRAAKLARIEYADGLPVLVDVAAALAAGGALVTEPLKLERGDLAAGFGASEHRVKGRVTIGGQEHFYLESQVALAIPGEDDEVLLQVSTQHPTEIQVMVAQVLGVPHAAVTVNMRRMGGGFGGKDPQGNLYAVVAALAAVKFKRAVKIRPDRDDDF